MNISFSFPAVLLRCDGVFVKSTLIPNVTLVTVPSLIYHFSLIINFGLNPQKCSNNLLTIANPFMSSNFCSVNVLIKRRYSNIILIASSIITLPPFVFHIYIMTKGFSQYQQSQLGVSAAKARAISERSEAQFRSGLTELQEREAYVYQSRNGFNKY